MKNCCRTMLHLFSKFLHTIYFFVTNIVNVVVNMHEQSFQKLKKIR